MQFETKEKTPHQKARQQNFIKKLLKKKVVKLEGDSYKCITCNKVVHNIIFHWNTNHKCIRCKVMKNTFKEHQCKNHKLKICYKQLKNPKNESSQKEVHNISDSSEKQNEAFSNITLVNISNNESKLSMDKTVSTKMSEPKINPVFASSQNEAYNISDSSENLSQQNENESNTKLTAKDNFKGKVEKIDDQIDETDEWSVHIKDLKKNKRYSKLFDGITDTPEKQNVAVSNITLTNVSNSHSISPSDEIISGKILEKRITQILTNVQSEKSYEKNNIPIYSFATPISVKSKSQRRKKEKNVQMKKDLNNLEHQVVDVLITPESDLPSNDEILSEERLLNKVHDKSNVKIIEDSDFSKLYNNTLQNLEMSAKSGITNIQTLKIKIPKNINRPLELIRDIPDSPERKKMKMIQNTILDKDVNDSKGEAGPSEVRRVEKEDLEILKTLCTKPCVHQSKNDEIYNSPEKQSGVVSNFSFVECVFCGLKNCPIEVQRLEVQRFEEEEEDEESANTPRHEEEVKETAKDARQQKGRKGKKSKNHNMKISKDTSKMLLILKCNKCRKEFDSTFELYKHQTRRHKVKFANSYSYLNDFQNFSLKKIMIKKLNDGTENTGLYIDTINIYNGHNQENICGRKKLENWVQLGVYTYLF